MILGLRAVVFHVDDLEKAKGWYSRVLEVEPYFDQPFYVGFAVGGFELGLVPDGTSGPGGSVPTSSTHPLQAHDRDKTPWQA